MTLWVLPGTVAETGAAGGSGPGRRLFPAGAAVTTYDEIAAPASSSRGAHATVTLPLPGSTAVIPTTGAAGRGRPHRRALDAGRVDVGARDQAGIVHRAGVRSPEVH